MFFTATDDECCPDWVIECQNFVCGDALQDAIYTSLFTDNKSPNCDDGGWWADPKKGSGLSRAVPNSRVNQSLAILEDEATAALQWLVSDGIISDLTVTAEYVSKDNANIKISFARPDGCSLIIPATFGQYGWVWNYGYN